MSIIYEKLEIPDNYKCSRCAAHGVKLWRQYNTMASHLELLCCRCANPKRAADMSIEGRSPVDDSIPKHRSDQLDDVVGIDPGLSCSHLTRRFDGGPYSRAVLSSAKSRQSMCISWLVASTRKTVSRL